MSLPPIVPRSEAFRRSRREAMLELLVDDPIMSVEKLCALTGTPPEYIRAMRKSDTFNADLTTRIRHKYGSSLAKVQQTVLDTQIAALDRMKRQLNDDALTPVVQQGAAEIALDHAIKLTALNVQSSNVKDSPPAVAITISINDLARAQQIAAERSNEITLEASDVSHAKPIQTQEHTYLTARRQERDEV